MGEAQGARPQDEWQARADEAKERAEEAQARIAELHRTSRATAADVNEALERAARARLHVVQGYGRAALAHERAAQLLDDLAANGGPRADDRRAAAARHRAAALDDRRAATRQVRDSVDHQDD
ncbi:hypothetical protein [Cellulomonas massiliensis]|uniref:hypothetical protein n=1 Tax=Cellulomonas massiliensis TaxID=1465811 RepID=UPI0003164E91|nr:hypothetical protein [Cellulomonas massiliensis]